MPATDGHASHDAGFQIDSDRSGRTVQTVLFRRCGDDCIAAEQGVCCHPAE